MCWTCGSGSQTHVRISAHRHERVFGHARSGGMSGCSLVSVVAVNLACSAVDSRCTPPGPGAEPDCPDRRDPSPTFRSRFRLPAEVPAQNRDRENSTLRRLRAGSGGRPAGGMGAIGRSRRQTECVVLERNDVRELYPRHVTQRPARTARSDHCCQHSFCDRGIDHYRGTARCSSTRCGPARGAWRRRSVDGRAAVEVCSGQPSCTRSKSDAGFGCGDHRVADYPPVSWGSDEGREHSAIGQQCSAGHGEAYVTTKRKPLADPS